jgi:hypothetical protein
MEQTQLLDSTISFLVSTLPFIIPALLVIVLYRVWMIYVQTKFLTKQEYVLLKIIPPRDVYKTPLAMELFINGLFQTHGESTMKEIFLDGGSRPWFSLEIASNEGQLNFYIWGRRQAVGFISTQLYSQYPGIEVEEVEDYTKRVPFPSDEYSIWPIEYHFTASNTIPIKTYIDYGLDKPAKEEEKVDPLTPTLDFFADTKPGEYKWLQILIRAHKKEDKNPKPLLEKLDLKKAPHEWIKKTDKWSDDVKNEIKSIKDQYKDDGDDEVKFTFNTKVQDERIAAIERSQSKLPFDVGIRGIYLGEKDVFDRANIGGMIGSFKQFSSPNLNGFKPGIMAKVDHWWQDPFGKKKKLMEKILFEDYVNRDYFFKDFLGKRRQVLVLNSEELATLFHFPGSTAQTPEMQRVQSKKTNAPANLPI